MEILTETALAQLRGDIGGNLDRYLEDESWIREYFARDVWAVDTRIELPNDFQLLLPDSDSSHDLENSKRIFAALGNLTPVQAADERLWAFLSHTRCWPYMRARWDIGGYRSDKRAQYIRERYFFMPNRDRALVRNGIARLWTYAFVTYDEEREDPFELTSVLLHKLDIAQQLLERSFSRNAELTKAVVDVVQTYPANGLDLTDRDAFREVMRHINRIGGITILDSLNRDELRRLVTGFATLVAQHRAGGAVQAV